jgi:hypothetical protein
MKSSFTQGRREKLLRRLGMLGNYNESGPKRASIIRLASATISSARLFSRFEGLSAKARVDPGAKIAALQPFPTGLTSIRYPLYSITVIACAISLRCGPRTKPRWLPRARWQLSIDYLCTSRAQDGNGIARPVHKFIAKRAHGSTALMRPKIRRQIAFLPSIRQRARDEGRGSLFEGAACGSN